MRRGERDGRLRWAFGFAVLLHAGALAVLAHLPLAQASSSLDEITVFGAGPSFSGSLVTIVDLPPASPPSGPVVGVAPEPGPKREAPRKPAPKPAAPPRPERPLSRTSVPSHTPAPPEEPVKPALAPPAPVPADPAGPDGQAGEPVAVGTPSPIGAVSALEVPGGVGQAPEAPIDGGDGGGGTEAPVTGGGGGEGGETGTGGHGQGGDGRPAQGEGQTGAPGEPAGPEDPGPPPVEWANPEVLRTARPAYPKAAAENGVEGTVVMKVLVGEQGEVVEAKVLRSSHDPRLDDAGLTAVRQWRYQPATQNGKPRRVYTRATIRFKLR